MLGFNKSDAEKVSQDAVNFITGVNAVRKCFVTGMGEDPIKCTFSNIYYGDSSNGGIILRFSLKCYYDSANFHKTIGQKYVTINNKDEDSFKHIHD